MNATSIPQNIAGHDLVLGHLSIATRLAYAYHTSYPRIELDDLKQAAYMGLLFAAKNFDDSKGRSFATYAGFWVRQQLSLCVVQNPRGCLFVPRHLACAHKQLLKFFTNNPHASTEDAQRHVNQHRENPLKQGGVLALLQVGLQCLSLDHPVGNEGRPLYEVVPEPNQEEDQDGWMELGKLISPAIRAMTRLVVHECLKGAEENPEGSAKQAVNLLLVSMRAGLFGYSPAGHYTIAEKLAELEIANVARTQQGIQQRLERINRMLRFRCGFTADDILGLKRGMMHMDTELGGPQATSPDWSRLTPNMTIPSHPEALMETLARIIRCADELGEFTEAERQHARPYITIGSIPT